MENGKSKNEKKKDQGKKASKDRYGRGDGNLDRLYLLSKRIGESNVPCMIRPKPEAPEFEKYVEKMEKYVDDYNDTSHRQRLTRQQGVLEAPLFHGSVSRNYVEQCLTSDGDYMLHYAKDDKSTIIVSVRWNGETKELKVQDKGEFDGVTIGGFRQMNGVLQLIEYHRNEEVPVSSDGTRLIRPIYRQSLYLNGDYNNANDGNSSGVQNCVVMLPDGILVTANIKLPRDMIRNNYVVGNAVHNTHQTPQPRGYRQSVSSSGGEFDASYSVNYNTIDPSHRLSASDYSSSPTISNISPHQTSPIQISPIQISPIQTSCYLTSPIQISPQQPTGYPNYQQARVPVQQNGYSPPTSSPTFFLPYCDHYHTHSSSDSVTPIQSLSVTPIQSLSVTPMHSLNDTEPVHVPDIQQRHWNNPPPQHGQEYLIGDPNGQVYTPQPSCQTNSAENLTVLTLEAINTVLGDYDSSPNHDQALCYDNQPTRNIGGPLNVVTEHYPAPPSHNQETPHSANVDQSRSSNLRNAAQARRDRMRKGGPEIFEKNPNPDAKPENRKRNPFNTPSNQIHDVPSSSRGRVLLSSTINDLKKKPREKWAPEKYD